MSMFVENHKVFRAMGSEPRQLILGAIDKGIKNPGLIGRELAMPRSTIEKHLRILLDVGLVSKVPVLNEHNRISVSYEVEELALKFKQIIDEE